MDALLAHHRVSLELLDLRDKLLGSARQPLLERLKLVCSLAVSECLVFVTAARLAVLAFLG